jgi:hypothetical protein
MQGRLSSALCDKISSFDIREPYVWRLKLSETDFNELEACLSAFVADKGKSALVTSDNAIYGVVYLAEWYKRKYQSGNKCDVMDGVDAEQLFRNSGISIKQYLYRDESGNKRWLYSIYVLGGLAIQHELSRNDNMKFLKGLCRIYHGENYTLENLDEASRAIAFRESIKRQHSLFEYMRQILNGEMPFNEEDLSNVDSDVNRFVATMKAANDEILKVKFRFEWQVTFSPQYTCMTRRLNVWLKPEEVGGELHQYLRYDRVHLWGVPNPEKQHKLYIYIRYKRNDEVVEPSTMDNPIITYLNTGQADTGFVAFGIEKCAQCKHVPTCKFDTIEIIAKDEDGKEYIAQSEAAREYLQLWRSISYGDTWTSSQNAQKETALLFSNHCSLKDESNVDDVYRKSFRDQKYGKSETFNWFYIYDSVTFTDEKGKEISLYNRIGYDQITTKLYSDSIHYVNGGKVKHYYIDAPEESDNYDIDELPLIFGWDDVIVRHFATKDDILNARPEEDCVAELIEFKQPNGRYQEWTLTDEPPYGEVQLRVTVKGRTFPYTVMYLPRLDEANPIRRDFETTCIRYRKPDMSEAHIEDTIPEDKKVLFPTVPVRFGEGEDFCEVDVYRPTLIKEVMLDGAIIDYKHDDEKVNLPYIFKDRVQVNDFSKHGYQSYDCKNLCSIYSQAYIDIEHNPSIGMAALNAWRLDRKFAGKLFDVMAPDCLTVGFGNAQNNTEWDGHEALFWNYDKNTTPVVIDPTKGTDSYDVGVVFQNLSKNKDLVCNLGEDLDNDPWAWDDIEESPLRCFEVANEADNYFFLMKALRDLSKEDIISAIYEPLLESRGGELTEKDKAGLIRLGIELGFDWQEHKIYLE